MTAIPPAPATEPAGDVVIRTVAMPADANAAGDIFGGWLLSQMDLGASVLAHRTAAGRVATVAVESMSFDAPVFVGDLVTCYARLLRVGRTSIAVRIEAWVRRQDDSAERRVTSGNFTYVAVDAAGKPRLVKPV